MLTLSFSALYFQYVFSRAWYSSSDIVYFCTLEVSSSQPLADREFGFVSTMCSAHLADDNNVAVVSRHSL